MINYQAWNFVKDITGIKNSEGYMTDRLWTDDYIEKNSGRFIEISDSIWEYAELAFHEFKSAKLIEDELKRNGFKVESGLAGIPTAFKGSFSFGSGKPVMGLLGEFDALSGLSQKAGVPEKSELIPRGAGHGCGHCALGAGSLAAAVAVKNYMEEFKMDGTVIYFGCPAEEGAGSKQFMARAGVFDGVDFVYTWHPSTKNMVESVHSNAIMGANFIFEGRSSHAGATPYLGRSALDACELMSVGCNYLREHVIPEARIHYAYIDAGGTAPNVVQDHAVVRYEVRAPYVSQVKELFERVKRVADGAAMMTDTSVSCELSMAFTEYIPNTALAAVADECMKEIGAPRWSEEDYELAKSFLESYNDEVKASAKKDIAETFGEERLDEKLQRPLDDDTHPFSEDKIRLQAGSTDVGDVGYAVPTLNINVATACLGNVGHTWQMTAQSSSSLSHKGMLTAAKILALSLIRTAKRPETISEAKKEVLKRNGGKYSCPLPDSVKPPLETY